MRRALLLLPLLLLAPQRSEARPAVALVRCEAWAEGGPNRLHVIGYGVDAADARQDALRVGRFLAEQQLAVDLWPWLMTGHAGARRVAEPRLTGVLADDPLRVPGFGWKPGPCSGQPLPEGKAFAATVGDITVQRASPGAAISAARRHGCVGAWSAGLSRGLLDLLAASPSERGDTLRAMLQGEVDRLGICLQGAPMLRAGKASATRAPKSGQVECHRRALDPKGMGGVGWGPDPEVASENAAWAALLSGGRALLSRGLEAWTVSPGERFTRIMDDLERLTVILPPGAPLERGLTTCTVVEDAAPLRFEARDPQDRSTCPAVEAPKAVSSEGARDALCQASLRVGSRASRDQVLRSGAGAAQDALRFSGWEQLLRCDAACIDSTSAGGGTTIALLGVPNRSSEKRSLALLIKAVKARDVQTAALVMPSVAEPAAIRQRQRRADDYWARIGVLLGKKGDSPELRAAYRWVEIQGAWLLLSRGG